MPSSAVNRMLSRQVSAPDDEDALRQCTDLACEQKSVLLNRDSLSHQIEPRPSRDRSMMIPVRCNGTPLTVRLPGFLVH
jgi:hypothetical protein